MTAPEPAADPGSPAPATHGLGIVEVAVTLAVPGRYHYTVPRRLVGRAQVGARVLVPFGRQKVTGVVVRAGGHAPDGITLVDVADVLDDEPALPHELVDLCLWVADYYEAPPGEVLRAALPAGSGIKAKKVMALTDAGRAALEGALPPKQRAALGRLEPGPIASAGLSTALRRVFAALVESGLVVEVEERDLPRARLKRERVVALAKPVDEVRAAVARAPKRLAIVDAIVAASVAPTAEVTSMPAAEVASASTSGDAPSAASTPTSGDAPTAASAATSGDAPTAASAATSGDAPTRSCDPVPVRLLDELPGATAHLRALANAGLVTITERERDLDAVAVGDTEGMALLASAPPVLTGEQTAAVEAITGALRGASAFTPFLLHGVTGSGKTEVYLRVIADALEAGKTALVLVPEISLTPQLAARFRARFGDQVAILHSGLGEQARLGEWSRLRRGQARIAVGARSAVFAPLAHLGVIVVDEEHDGSFKQEEGVRYHARDVAMVRAQRAGAVCVLGSATPSLESYAHAERGQYKLLVLTQRPTARREWSGAGLAGPAGSMPGVEIVDLRTFVPDGDALLSSPLRTAIAETLAAGDQIILFLNRRGFATFVLCRACGHSFRCRNCSVSMTYHRHSDRLTCHYCGLTERVPDICPECKGVETIIRKGLGTEKVADAVAAEFASARVARLDRDVASGAKVEAVLARVARREVDILVGTQMVTKGHDFPGVTLVGVLCADTGLDLPDFRASERTFQLLAQVAGRAGRGDRAGRVIVQTYRPGAAAVTAAAAHDYERFFRAETQARAELGYPPHGRLVAVRIDGANEHEVAGVAKRLAELAESVAKRPDLGGTVEIRGPVPAPIEKLRGRTRWQIWLRSGDRQALRRVARAIGGVENARTVRVTLDVDPMSAL